MGEGDGAWGMGDGVPGEPELMVTWDHGRREQDGEMDVLRWGQMGSCDPVQTEEEGPMGHEVLGRSGTVAPR